MDNASLFTKRPHSQLSSQKIHSVTHSFMPDVRSQHETPVNQTKKTLKPTFREHIKVNCRNFAKKTTCHGLSRIIDENESSFIRTVWLLAVIGFLIVALTAIWNSVWKTFLQAGVSVEIVPVEMNHGEFPDIHICDSSIYNKTVLEGFGFDDELASYLTISLSPTAASPLLVKNSTRQRQLQNRLERLLAVNSLSAEDVINRSTLGYKSSLSNLGKTILKPKIKENETINSKCESMVTSCLFNSLVYSGKECCDSFFGGVSFPSMMGSCISTHFAVTQVHQKFSCQMFGLVVFLRHNQDRINFDRTIVSMILSSRRGYVYSASDDIVHPALWMLSHGQLAEPGKWILLEMTRTDTNVEEILQSWIVRGQCAHRSDGAFQQLVEPFPAYSQHACRMKNSLLAAIERTVNCTLMSVPHLGYKVCSPQALIDFVKQAASAPQKLEDSKAEMRAEECVSDCIYRKYTLTSSTATMDTAESTVAMETPANITEAPNSNTALHFYYPGFSHVVTVKHYPSVIAWIGELGGNLGLFLGSSLITIMEIIVFCYHCCFLH